MQDKYKGLKSLSEAVESGLWEQMTGARLGRMTREEALRGLGITKEVKITPEMLKKKNNI